MIRTIVRKAAPFAGAVLASGAFIAPVSAQSIVFSEGGADLTFFHDSSADSWDVVFRQKGNTVATGLTSQIGRAHV